MWRQIPNALTMARFGLIYGMVEFHSIGRPLIGFAFALLACATDWLDGKLARAWNCPSKFGEAMDPWADKFACWCLAYVVFFGTPEPPWLVLPMVIIMMMYDTFFGVIRAVWGRRNIPTSDDAKKKTLCLMSSLLTVYLGIALGVVPIVFIDTPVHFRQIGILIGASLGCFSLWYMSRSAVRYIRAYGWGEWIPRPFHLL